MSEPPEKERRTGASPNTLVAGDPRTGTGSAAPSRSEVEALLDSLVGVLSAQVSLEGETVREVHVLAAPGTEVPEVVQAVSSALRARFDLRVDRDGVFVARTRLNGSHDRPSAAVRARGESGAALAVGPRGGAGSSARGGEPRPRSAGPSPERHAAAPPVPESLSPPPWPERSRSGGPEDVPEGTEEGDPLGARLESSSRRVIPRRIDDSRGMGSRLLFLGHQTAKRRFEAVEVGVELEWRGRPFHGTATVADHPDTRLQAPAVATLRAVEHALAQRPAGDPPVDLTLTLGGVELVEAFGERHVMVSVSAGFGGGKARLTGCVEVEDSVELATILATLQATDRRVRAVLLNFVPAADPASR